MGRKIVHALRGVGAIFALLAVWAALPAIAGAATITVTTASDVSATQCTLRNAITFTPLGGDLNSRSKAVNLIKRP
jgi:hypothetical protein